MMKTILKIVLVVVALVGSHAASAQHIGLFSGEKFTFSNGVEEWSDPLSFQLASKEEGESIPLSVRLKYKKRLLLACHYVIEFTNLSDTKSVSFQVGTGYTDYKGKDVVEKFKLKPRKTGEGKLIYAEGLKKPKSAADCINCDWFLNFFGAKIK